ncbi:MAG: glycosyltransferase [Winogradskyella sp.]|uniref:glycosyltransferase n=1 Tax=Winogradskyella sp. TaxID=1883156 RepID=UPI00185D7C42|nr:glycosyltransferase [Winogradskyella sp.]
MYRGKRIAVVCNYQLKNNRIGSMDRFFIAFNKGCLDHGYVVDWFFPNSKNIELYSDVNFYSDDNSNIETLFLNHIKKTKANYNYVFTHFIELFTPFYKKVKHDFHCEIIAVDHMSRPINGFSFKKKLKRKIKFFMYGKYIDKVIAVSQYIKSQNLKDYSISLKSKIDVIYNGINLELYGTSHQSKAKASSKFNFIVVSHLVYEKGIQDMILALSKLENRIRKKITIDIYGEGIYKSALVDLVNAYNLEDVFIFKGSVDNLYSLYSNYDYMIQPTYMEAFSLSILESLFSSVPVITTTVGGNNEVVEHGINGYLFEPKNIEELKEILIDICDNKMSLEQSNIYEDIRSKYTLDIMVDNYLKLL